MYLILIFRQSAKRALAARYKFSHKLKQNAKTLKAAKMKLYSIKKQCGA